MAITIGQNVESGSSFTKGVLSIEESHASDSFKAEGLPATTTQNDLQQAADSYATAAGDTHPDDSTLPLRGITARLVRPGVAIGVGTYARRSDITVPTVSAHLLTDRRPGIENFTYYQRPNVLDSDRRPAGALLGLHYRSGVPLATAYPWPVETEVILMQTILDFDPSEVVRQFKNCVNSNSIALSQIVSENGIDDNSSPADEMYAAHTLKFSGASVKAIPATCGVVVYNVVYQFIHVREPGWVQQTLASSSAPFLSDMIVNATVLGQAAIVNYVIGRELVDFTAGLPTHVPGECS